MRRTKLKHYLNYLDRLMNFSAAMGISIVFKEYDQNGAWVPAAMRVILDDEMTNTDTIATFLHELGHAMDDLYPASEPEIIRQNKAYDAIYRSCHTDKQLGVVLNSEQRAWKYGREIAKRLKIPLGLWYGCIEKECIKNYKES